MYHTTKATVQQLKLVVVNLPGELYTNPSDLLGGATIGQHCRHVIELFTCLLEGYESGLINYDNRKRNKFIETNIEFAAQQLQLIEQSIEQENKALIISYELNGTEIHFESNYNREVMYNLEHTIHHEALMKVAISEHSGYELPAEFGVAPSTLQYRMSCAQ